MQPAQNRHASHSDDIPEDLLEGIPDVGDGSDDGILELQPIPEEPTTGDAAADLVLLLVQARRQMESALAREFARLEKSFPQTLHDLETKLAQTEAQLIQTRAEHQKVKAEHDKKTAALRELKKSLEGL